MRDIDHGDAEPLLEIADLLAHRAAKARVEVRERLVEKQNIGFEDQRTGQRDALLLPAGHLGRQAVAEALEAHGGQCFLGFLVGVGLRHAAGNQPEGHVLAHTHVRKQRVGLEHHGDVALAGGKVGHVASADHDPPFRGTLQPGDHAQQGRLAAAGGSKQRDERARRDHKVERLDRRHLAVAFCDPREADFRARLGGIAFRAHALAPWTVGTSTATLRRPSRRSPTASWMKPIAAIISTMRTVE